MNYVIWKYPLFVIDQQQVEMPAGSKILHVDDQDGQLTMWAFVDKSMPLCQRAIQIIGTGNPVSELPTAIIGTAVMQSGLVWHVFDNGEQK